MNRDFVSGCVLLVFSIVYYAAASAIPISKLADTVGAQGMPKSYGVALGILSILLIGQSFLARRRTLANPPAAADRAEALHKDGRAALRAGGMLAIGIVYIVALPWLGYVISLALLIGVVAWYQERARRRWLVPTAVVGAGVFWLIFVEILQIAEPAGIWPSLF
jgi:hypothetical protein